MNLGQLRTCEDFDKSVCTILSRDNLITWSIFTPSLYGYIQWMWLAFTYFLPATDMNQNNGVGLQNIDSSTHPTCVKTVFSLSLTAFFIWKKKMRDTLRDRAHRDETVRTKLKNVMPKLFDIFYRPALQ